MTGSAQEIVDNFEKLSVREKAAVLSALERASRSLIPALEIKISGPAGAGKTALGEKLAGLLQAEGHEVYYYEAGHNGLRESRFPVPPREGLFIPTDMYKEGKRKIVIRTKHEA